jgi:hypothetical protein
MAKKVRKSKAGLKKKASKPRKLLPYEAIELSLYPVKKDSLAHQLNLIDAKMKNVVLQAKTQTSDLQKERNTLSGSIRTAREEYNLLVESIKEKYGAEQLGFDLETLEIGVE